MNSIVQKVHSVVMFLMILGMVWIGLIMKPQIELDQDDIDKITESLKQDVNASREDYKRLELIQIGHGKHLNTTNDTIKVRHDRYNDKMESIDDEFQRLSLQLEQLKEMITQKLDRISDDIVILRDEFSTNKRNQNRTVREIKMNISTLQDQFEALDRQLNPKNYEKEKGDE